MCKGKGMPILQSQMKVFHDTGISCLSLWYSQSYILWDSCFTFKFQKCSLFIWRQMEGGRKEREYPSLSEWLSAWMLGMGQVECSSHELAVSLPHGWQRLCLSHLILPPKMCFSKRLGLGVKLELKPGYSEEGCHWSQEAPWSHQFDRYISIIHIEFVLYGNK